MINLVTALTLLSPPPALVNSSGPCDYLTSDCPSVTNTGSEVVIGAERPGTSDGSVGRRPDRDVAEEPAPQAPAQDCGSTSFRQAVCYTVAIITPTIDDVARFAPASLPLVDEPDGVGVVGMPVNFVVAPSVHEQAGELFDLAVSVRFTPASVVFVYGDGDTRTARSGGRTWAQLGLPQFSATSTSHGYAARGTYTAHAVVQYTAEFNLGRGWVPIAGILQIPTPSTDLTILEARTALVDRTCVENPDGPGC